MKVGISACSNGQDPEYLPQIAELIKVFDKFGIEAVPAPHIVKKVDEFSGTDEERAALANEDTNENGSVLLYSFPVLIMEDEEDGSKNLGAGFNRSPKADVMLKLYGDDFIEAENSYQDLVTDAVLDHGVLFLKAVESIQKV